MYEIESSDTPGPNLEVMKIISEMLANAKKIITYIEFLKYLVSFIYFYKYYNIF